MTAHAHRKAGTPLRRLPSRDKRFSELRLLWRSPAGRWLIGAVGAIAILTVIGLLGLWSRSATPGANTVGGTVPATVERVIDKPCAPPAPQLCRSIVVTVEGRRVELGVNLTRLSPTIAAGDHVRLTRPGDAKVQPSTTRRVHYDFAQVDHRGSLVWMAVLVAIAAAALLRWRGVLAVVGVALSLSIVVWFLVPAILAGRPALLVALVAALAVMFVTLVLTNGLGAQTLAAALGVSAALAFTCLLAWMAVRFAHLDGSADVTLLGVGARRDALSLNGITLAAMLVGALGVLADTAVTQASAVMALRRANPKYTARVLYREGFVIGRDHLSATIHTLVLAYAGAALPLLLLLRSSQAPAVDVLNNQSIAEPIVATLVGCLALIGAVPLATGLAALLVARVPAEMLPDAHHHH